MLGKDDNVIQPACTVYIVDESSWVHHCLQVNRRVNPLCRVESSVSIVWKAPFLIERVSGYFFFFFFFFVLSSCFIEISVFTANLIILHSAASNLGLCLS